MLPNGPVTDTVLRRPNHLRTLLDNCHPRYTAHAGTQPDGHELGGVTPPQDILNVPFFFSGFPALEPEGPL